MNVRILSRGAISLIPLITFCSLGIMLSCQQVLPAAGQDNAAVDESAKKLDVRLPLRQGSVRFAVIGDNGTGNAAEFEVAQQMERYREIVKFDFVLMLGDNIYGGHRPEDFHRKFEEPYQPLLDAGVKFYASLGNHDDPNVERLYKPFNMGGDRYYTFTRGPAEFFALDSNYMDAKQQQWLEDKLRDSNAKWKICYFHHPLYSDGKFHGSDLDLRARLVPIFKRHDVNLVLSGHDHVYERLKPQDGIYYFVLGSSGQLRFHNLRRAEDMASGFDTDQTFMLMEIDGDHLYYQTISRTGETIDSGTLQRQTGSASVLHQPVERFLAAGK